MADLEPARLAGDPLTTDRDLAVTDPWSGRELARVPVCGAEQVDRACRAAAEALAAGDWPQHQRAETLERASALARARRDDLAATITAESGKPITTARAEVDRCVDTLAFSAVEARSLVGEMVPMAASAGGRGKLGFALRVPLGVVAAITPFNFPLNLAAHKVAPAIAAGCPVVLKPAPATPLTALALADLLVDAGMPPAWLSVLTDAGSDAGQPLVDHPVPAMVSFTGSAPVGWSIAAAAPRKRVALELGSASPLIVEPDADLDLVAGKVAAAGYAHAGQSCISVQRVLAAREVHDELAGRLVDAVEALVVGDPADEATAVGPLIDQPAAERVEAWIGEAVDGGAQALTGGQRDGAVLTPAVVADPPRDGRLWREEAFGPVVTLTAYHDVDEAFALAGDGDLALHVGLFTDRLTTAMRAVRELDFGGVLVGEVPTFRADQQPYGGRRESGNTREGPVHTVREMTDLRFVSLPG